jgi:PAS domain-containing protein
MITPLIEQTKPRNRLLITGININERKQLQEELDVSRNRYRSVIQSVHDCIVTTDEQSNIVLFNKAAELTWGYSLKEVVGQKLTMLLANKYRQDHQRFVDDFSTSITQITPNE